MNNDITLPKGITNHGIVGHDGPVYTDVMVKDIVSIAIENDRMQRSLTERSQLDVEWAVLRDLRRAENRPPAIADREKLMRAIIETGQRVGIVHTDLETASVTECLHILECMLSQSFSVKPYIDRITELNNEMSAMEAVMEFVDPATWPGLTAAQRCALGRFAKPQSSKTMTVPSDGDHLRRALRECGVSRSARGAFFGELAALLARYSSGQPTVCQECGGDGAGGLHEDDCSQNSSDSRPEWTHRKPE